MYLTYSSILINLGKDPGKRNLVKDLSRMCGRLCLSLDGTVDLSSSSLLTYFKGVCSSGSWLYLNRFDSLQKSVLSRIGDALYNLRFAILQKHDKLQVRITGWIELLKVEAINMTLIRKFTIFL